VGVGVPDANFCGTKIIWEKTHQLFLFKNASFNGKPKR
jgi:hypothetical protein